MAYVTPRDGENPESLVNPVLTAHQVNLANPALTVNQVSLANLALTVNPVLTVILDLKQF